MNFHPRSCYPFKKITGNRGRFCSMNFRQSCFPRNCRWIPSDGFSIKKKRKEAHRVAQKVRGVPKIIFKIQKIIHEHRTIFCSVKLLNGCLQYLLLSRAEWMLTIYAQQILAVFFRRSHCQHCRMQIWSSKGLLGRSSPAPHR